MTEVIEHMEEVEIYETRCKADKAVFIHLMYCTTLLEVNNPNIGYCLGEKVILNFKIYTIRDIIHNPITLISSYYVE